MTVPERLAALRAEMKARNIDMYIVPTADFHESEYVGEHFKARRFITGFTGSAGTAVITMDDAGLWTDGRYFLQAAAQLEGSGIELIVPEGEDQAAVMDIIYNGIKAGDMAHDTTALRATIENLLARGAETLILGCTELPLAVQIYNLDYPTTDPTLELALGAIRFAGCETK